MEALKHKKIAIVGFGIEGQSSASYLASKGLQVTVFDEKKEEELDSKTVASLRKKEVSFVLGAPFDLKGFDIIVRSPGVSLHHPALESARTQGAHITSLTQIFLDLAPCKIIGVTGTKGKGTTSSLIYEMLKKEGIDAYLGGNIGIPALSFLDKLTPESMVVLELSSFQLQGVTKSPHIAVMLMITSEHLDYHKDIQEYIDAKRNIIHFQSPEDYAILNIDYPATRESDIHTNAQLYEISRITDFVQQGCFVEDEHIVLRMDGEDRKVMKTADILLPGGHNLENVCAAIMAATLAGVSVEHIRAVLKSFKGLEHRLELIATVKGVRYYDDSFSTTPETAQAAIESFADPEILILGGSSKKSDFTGLGRLISNTHNIKAIIGIGSEWEAIKNTIENKNIPMYEGFSSLKEVVAKAAEIAEIGDVVLLSPACASFDMFKNYKDRGDQFKKYVKTLQ